uniref:Glycerol-3-phosphate dehydrogenase [NAD(P)+] n=1 Tax=Lygus hesperus TaxID=30085 RepID=A0A0A9YQ10_LYGHE
MDVMCAHDGRYYNNHLGDLEDGAEGGDYGGPSTDVPTTTTKRGWLTIATEWFVACTIIAIVLSLLYIRIPQYSLCYRAINWIDVLMSLLRWNNTNNFTLLFSVYNPNIYELTINTLSGVVDYSGTRILEFSLNATTLRPGYIQDIILPETLHATYMLLYELLNDYYNSNLVLRTVIDVQASVRVFGFLPAFNLPSIHYDGTYNIFDLPTNN